MTCPDCEANADAGTMLEAWRNLHRSLHALWATLVLDTPLRLVAGPDGVEHYERIRQLAQDAS